MAEQKGMGPVAFVIVADPDQKLVIFQFGTPINRLELGPEEALQIATTIMSRASVASGKSIARLVAEQHERNQLAKPQGT